MTPKDVTLRVIHDLGIKGGIGFAYEYGGDVFDDMSMEGRMTVCNMSIEGGARIGYVNPDETTFDYLEGREFSPEGRSLGERLGEYWREIATGDDAEYDDIYEIAGESIEPMVTWGINPGHSVGISEPLPEVEQLRGRGQEDGGTRL